VPLTKHWSKASASSNNGCVETRLVNETVQMRDSKSPADEAIVFTPDSWAMVLDNVRRDKFQFTVDGVQFTLSTNGGFTVSTPQDGRPIALSFTAREKAAFRTGVIAGEFDLPATV
jgi:hypothetical protein